MSCSHKDPVPLDSGLGPAAWCPCCGALRIGRGRWIFPNDVVFASRKREAILLGAGYCQGLAGSGRPIEDDDRKLLDELAACLRDVIGFDPSDPSDPACTCPRNATTPEEMAAIRVDPTHRAPCPRAAHEHCCPACGHSTTWTGRQCRNEGCERFRKKWDAP